MTSLTSFMRNNLNGLVHVQVLNQMKQRVDEMKAQEDSNAKRVAAWKSEKENLHKQDAKAANE